MDLCNGTVSVSLSVCLSRLSTAAAVRGGLLLWVTWAENIDRQRRRRSNGPQQQTRAVSYRQLTEADEHRFVFEKGLNFF